MFRSIASTTRSCSRIGLHGRDVAALPLAEGSFISLQALLLNIVIPLCICIVIACVKRIVKVHAGSMQRMPGERQGSLTQCSAAQSMAATRETLYTGGYLGVVPVLYETLRNAPWMADYPASAPLLISGASLHTAGC